MIKATTDIFLKPYQEYERGRKEHPDPSIARSLSNPTPHKDSISDSVSVNSRDSDKGKIALKTTASMMGGSAKGVGKFIGSVYKGLIIDIPLATTEGLRAVPRLYGEEVKDYGRVTDWKSGGIVAGKNFVGGMADGITDLFMQPYKGGKEEGALGVAKGIAKGTLGITTKCSAGM